MARFDELKGVFGLLPTPYNEDLEINEQDLRSVTKFCCESNQHGIVWPVMVGEFYFLGEEERIRGLDIVMDEITVPGQRRHYVFNVSEGQIIAVDVLATSNAGGLDFRLTGPIGTVIPQTSSLIDQSPRALPAAPEGAAA